MRTLPKKTLGCRASSKYHSEAARLAEKMSAKTGKTVTHTTILLMSHDFGFPLIERYIEAVGDCATKTVLTEPEMLANAARDLVIRGWKSLQHDLASLPSPSF